MKVLNGCRFVPKLEAGSAATVVSLFGVGLQLNRLRVIGKCLFVISQVIVGISPVAVGTGIAAKANRLGEIFERPCFIAECVASQTPVAVGTGIAGIQFKSAGAVNNSFLMLGEISLGYTAVRVS